MKFPRNVAYFKSEEQRCKNMGIEYDEQERSSQAFDMLSNEEPDIIEINHWRDLVVEGIEPILDGFGEEAPAFSQQEREDWDDYDPDCDPDFPEPEDDYDFD